MSTEAGRNKSLKRLLTRSPATLLLTAVMMVSVVAALCTLVPANDVEATEKAYSISMIADAKLTDQHGRKVKLADLEDKLVLVNFFFTGCEGACPLQTSVLRDVRKQLPIDIDVIFLSVSIAPYADTPESINRYIDKYKLDDSDWKFATTSVDRLKQLIDHFGVTVDNAVVSDGQLDHRNNGYLFGKNGTLMQQYQLLPGITERLSREIVQLNGLHL